MARRNRFSRGVPYVMSSADKQNFLRALDLDPDLREDVETLLGVELSSLTEDERITALRDYEDANFGTAQLAQMAKARNDLHREAARKRGDLEARDQMALLEEKNTILQEQVETLANELAEERGQAPRRRTTTRTTKEK